jgi:5-methyltetrahydrofolate--homocysteine methyltransferase
MTTYDALKDAVIRGDGEAVKAETNKALTQGLKPQDILVNGLVAGMEIVGEGMESGDMFLPEVLASAGAMHKGLDIVRPLLAKSGEGMGKVVIGTVEGDLHDVGKRIVGFILEGAGLLVTDLGVNVKPEVFAQAITEHKPDIMGMSALLTTTLPNMGKTVDLLKKLGLRNKVKVIIGGVAASESFAKTIGADAYAPDASSAAKWAKQVMATRQSQR